MWPSDDLLGLAQVGDQRPGGLDLGGVVVDAEAGERGRAELLEERLAGLLGLEVPRGPDRDRRPPTGRGAPRTHGASRLSSEIRISAGLSRATSSTSSVRSSAGQREPAGRELDPGQAELAADLDDRRQVVGRLGVEELVVGQRARA